MYIGHVSKMEAQIRRGLVGAHTVRARVNVMVGLNRIRHEGTGGTCVSLVRASR